MPVLLKTAAWLMCVVYATIPLFWLLIHPRADFWRSRSRSPYRFLLPAWIGMWVMLGLLTAHWRRSTLYETPWAWAIALLLLALGLAIYKRAGVNFSAAQLGGLPELLPGHGQQGLVTNGIRSRVRHPVYLGHLCEMLAWSIGSGLAICYGLTAFAMVTGTIMIQLEDRELEQRFGDDYRQYRRQVPALLPRFSTRTIYNPTS